MKKIHAFLISLGLMLSLQVFAKSGAIQCSDVKLNGVFEFPAFGSASDKSKTNLIAFEKIEGSSGVPNGYRGTFVKKADTQGDENNTFIKVKAPQNSPLNDQFVVFLSDRAAREEVPGPDGSVSPTGKLVSNCSLSFYWIEKNKPVHNIILGQSQSGDLLLGGDFETKHPAEVFRLHEGSVEILNNL